MGSLLLCPGSWSAQGFVCALQEFLSPVLCKFWQLYGGVNGDLLQEGLCHTQVCRTQSPCPCLRPLLTCTSAGDTQTLKGTVVLKTLQSPLDSKEIKPVNPKGNQSWMFIGRTDAEADTPIPGRAAKNWVTGKDSDAGQDWRQEEKGMTEDEMVGSHDWFNGHEFEQAPEVGDGQGGLACCSPWGHKRVGYNWVTELNWIAWSPRVVQNPDTFSCQAWSPLCSSCRGHEWVWMRVMQWSGSPTAISPGPVHSSGAPQLFWAQPGWICNPAPGPAGKEALPTERSRYLPTRSYGGIAPAPRGLVLPTLGETQAGATGPGWGLLPGVKRPLPGLAACPLSVEGPLGHRPRYVLLQGSVSPWCGRTTGAPGLADGAYSCPCRERTAASAARGYGASRGRATGASTANYWSISAATCSSHWPAAGIWWVDTSASWDAVHTAAPGTFGLPLPSLGPNPVPATQEMRRGGDVGAAEWRPRSAVGSGLVPKPQESPSTLGAPGSTNRELPQLWCQPWNLELGPDCGRCAMRAGLRGLSVTMWKDTFYKHLLEGWNLRAEQPPPPVETQVIAVLILPCSGRCCNRWMTCVVMSQCVWQVTPGHAVSPEAPCGAT